MLHGHEASIVASNIKGHQSKAKDELERKASSVRMFKYQEYIMPKVKSPRFKASIFKDIWASLGQPRLRLLKRFCSMAPQVQMLK